MNRPSNDVAALTSRIFRDVDGAWLAALRILFGSAMCVSMCRFLAYGWVDRFFVTPSMHFKYWGFSWVEPLAPWGMHALFWVLAVLAACVALGLFFRLASAAFSVGLVYVQLIDVSTYLNHYYLAALLSCLLTVSPAATMWSLDRWRHGRSLAPGRSGRSERVSAFWLFLLRFQVGTVYVFAGLAKLNEDWLIHAQPLRIWLGARTDVPLLGPLFTVEGVPLLMSWAGFLFDTTVVAWLAWRRTRLAAYAVLLLFHALTRVLFPIGMFPVIMSIAALVFFEPSWPRELALRVAGAWVRVTGRAAAISSAEDARPVSSPHDDAWGKGRRKVALACGGAYVALQLLLPLRHLAYPGNVMWHEQGMRFSWRVMLRAKGGSATFLVEEAHSQRSLRVAPRDYLADFQEAEMVSQPDLILQLAHHIERDFEGRGWQDVKVRVDSRVALNGRRSARLIDPDIDLTTRRDGLGSLGWVTRAPSEPPTHTRPVL